MRRGFEHPPDDARIMMRWWWFGPAASRAELEREMRAMKQGGIGGFGVQPVYPLEVESNYPYLSDMQAVVRQPSGFLGPVRLVSR